MGDLSLFDLILISPVWRSASIGVIADAFLDGIKSETNIVIALIKTISTIISGLTVTCIETPSLIPAIIPVEIIF